jgi:mycofactocin system FadH/OYE family oxidoreductase 2
MSKNSRPWQLLAPLKINGKTLKNRVVMAPHGTNFGVNNNLSQRHVDYYRERARGGVGMIIVEEASVHPSDYPYERVIQAWKPDVVAGYRQVAAAVQQEGAVLIAALNHSGSQGDTSLNQQVLWGPSPVVAGSEVPKEMEREDIAGLVQGFGQAVEHIKAAGVDGVEINLGQRSLLRQFLSPLTNLRQDEYGGDLDNRLRLFAEVLEEIKKRIDDQFIVGVRLTVDEYAPWAGIKPEDALEIAGRIEKLGGVDYLSVSVGSIYTLHLTRPTMHTPEAFAAEHAANLKNTIAMPVLLGGRIHNPELAERLLNEDKADLVEMTRSLIADPQLLVKTAENKLDQIRRCIACNQGCQVLGPQNRVLSCVQNPLVGHERDLGGHDLGKPGRQKKVMIIGAGPAGMEAARVAALRGHQVQVFDQGKRAGGKILLGAQVPGRERMAGITRFLLRQLAELKVPVHLEVKVTAEMVAEAGCDVVVVATGSAARRPELAADGLQVVTGEQVWQGAAVGDKVLVVEETGGYRGTGLIEKLIAGGKQVSVVTWELFVGLDLAPMGDLTPFNQRVLAKNVVFHTRHKVKWAKDGLVGLTERYSGQEKVIDGIDTIVYCLPNLPEEDLFLQLHGRVAGLYRAGDCVAPRGIGMAILEGYQIGRLL